MRGVFVRNARRIHMQQRTAPPSRRLSKDVEPPVDQHRAYLFNRKPGTPLEGWEPIAGFTYVAAAVIMLAGAFGKPNTNLMDWAKDEAHAREERYLQGKPVEYGVHYSNEGRPTKTEEES